MTDLSPGDQATRRGFRDCAVDLRQCRRIHWRVTPVIWIERNRFRDSRYPVCSLRQRHGPHRSPGGPVAFIEGATARGLPIEADIGVVIPREDLTEARKF